MKTKPIVLSGFLGVAAALLWSGCGDTGPTAATGGGHHHDSVHGGVAVELGEHQFHLDFLHDPKVGTLTAWVMDAHVENFVRVPLKGIPVNVVAAGKTNALTLEPVANTASGETVGDTSMYRAEAAWLKEVQKFTATVPEVEIRGAKFSNVSFEYPKDDDHHGHKH